MRLKTTTVVPATIGLAKPLDGPALCQLGTQGSPQEESGRAVRVSPASSNWSDSGERTISRVTPEWASRATHDGAQLG